MGTPLLSRRSWSVHLVRGRPGGRFHEGSGVDQPKLDLPCVLSGIATSGNPVRQVRDQCLETSELRTKSCHLIPRIPR